MPVKPFTLHKLAANVTTLELGPHTLHFSYDTCVAYAGPAWPKWVRRAKVSPTTSKHLGIAGAKAWDKLPEEVFEHVLRKAFPLQPVKP